MNAISLISESFLAHMVKSIGSCYALQEAYRQGDAVARAMLQPSTKSIGSFIHLGFELERRQ